MYSNTSQSRLTTLGTRSSRISSPALPLLNNRGAFEAARNAVAITLFVLACGPATVVAASTDDRPADPPAHAILEAQALLEELGYGLGTPDGKWGELSAKAYGQFLRDVGEPAEAVLTPANLQLLREQAASGRNKSVRSSSAGNDSLIDSAIRGDVPAVQAILRGRTELDATDQRNWTALMHAANKGYVLLVELLMDHGADPNVRAVDGATALFIAALHGHHHIAKQLLQAGANPRLAGPKGRHPADLLKEPPPPTTDDPTELEDYLSANPSGLISEWVRDRLQQKWEALDEDVRASGRRQAAAVDALNAYLMRKPQGMFARRATDHLRELWWDPIKDDPESIEAYLARSPNGRFGELARRRLAEIEEQSRREMDEALNELLRAANASAHPRVGSMFRDCSECPQMVVVPAGRSPMGGGQTIEWQVMNPFAVSKFEVTRQQYQSFVALTKYRPDRSCVTYQPNKGVKRNLHWRNPGFRQAGNEPVVCVGPEDARAYIDWLSTRTGRSYRLMTSFEWLHVATEGRGLPGLKREPPLFRVGDWLTKIMLDVIREHSRSSTKLGTPLTREQYTTSMTESGLSHAMDYERYVEQHKAQQELVSSAAYRAKQAAQVKAAEAWIHKQCDHGNGLDQALNSGLHAVPCNDGHAHTAPVGSYTPNAFGVHDILGNVSEWLGYCMESPWGRTDESYRFPWFPASPDSAMVDCGVAVGGSWAVASPVNGFGDRYHAKLFSSDEDQQGSIGFRVARDVGN